MIMSTYRYYYQSFYYISLTLLHFLLEKFPFRKIYFSFAIFIHGTIRFTYVSSKFLFIPLLFFPQEGEEKISSSCSVNIITCISINKVNLPYLS